ncbi:hypothetical protein L486_08564 [Kwoniella mangroviensis CBS 10435]|uniref:Uncharacterized protein n=1 Tax=Kwoniella mangroviensis CBS 10435 TaxID=1331196 RepID=A0A1B9IEF8_9TREE|nr:hypothetical protein L486_08564 [Kwoniella mangroviensis CBS 10435]
MANIPNFCWLPGYPLPAVRHDFNFQQMHNLLVTYQPLLLARLPALNLFPFPIVFKDKNDLKKNLERYDHVTGWGLITSLKHFKEFSSWETGRRLSVGLFVSPGGFNATSDTHHAWLAILSHNFHHPILTSTTRKDLVIWDPNAWYKLAPFMQQGRLIHTVRLSESLNNKQEQLIKMMKTKGMRVWLGGWGNEEQGYDDQCLGWSYAMVDLMARQQQWNLGMDGQPDWASMGYHLIKTY